MILISCDIVFVVNLSEFPEDSAPALCQALTKHLAQVEPLKNVNDPNLRSTLSNLSNLTSRDFYRPLCWQTLISAVSEVGTP